MYEARWQNGNPQWMAVDVIEAARLLAAHPGGRMTALAKLHEGESEVVTAYVAEHPAETNGIIEVRLRPEQPYTRPTPTPEENGDIIFA